jgi:hypothetical protein
MRTIVPAVLGCLILFCVGPLSIARAKEHWFTSVYAGEYSHNALNEIIRFQTKFESSYVNVVSVGKEVGRLTDAIGMELEGQVAVHSGRQDNAEINGAFTLRWLPFPWDRYLDTSFAFGNGISYATAKPELEIIDSDDNDTSQWLYYILVEMAFKIPRQPQWEVFVRIHHRSSVFGLINRVYAGSNFVGLGLRYRFN